MRETPLYQGNQYREASQPQAQMPQLKMPENPFERVLPQAVKTVEAAVDDYTDLVDDRQKLQKLGERTVLKEEAQNDLRRRMELPWGSEDSVYDQYGKINKDKVRSLEVQYQQKLLSTQGNYWKRRNNMQDEAALKTEVDLFRVGMYQTLGEQERRNMVTVFRDTFDLMEAKGDAGGAYAVADLAARDGLITPQRAEAMKLGVARRSTLAGARQSGQVVINGKTLKGWNAVLAAADERDGIKRGEDAGEKRQEPAASGLEPSSYTAGLTSVTVAEPSAGEPKSTLEAAEQQAATLQPMTPSEQWISGDDAGVIRTMPASEMSELSASLTPPVAVSVQETDEGTRTYSAPSWAPDSVRYMVNLANREGGISKESAETVIAEVTLDLISASPDMSSSSILNSFDGSGIYEALGDGDAEVGKARAETIVRSFINHGKSGTGRVLTDSVRQAVSARVNSHDLFVNKDWKRMERLNPGLEAERKGLMSWVPSGEYKKPKAKDTAKLKRWNDLKAIYAKHRKFYNPVAAKAGALTDEEFEEHAQGFYNWYMGGSGIYERESKKGKELVTNYYMARCMQALAEATEGIDSKTGAAKYSKESGYAKQVDVINAVLKEEIPDNLSGEHLVDVETKHQERILKLSESFRKDAEDSYAKLRTWKEAQAEKEEAAKSAKKAEEARVDAELTAAKKEGERRVKMAQVQEASRIRSADWGWMGAEGEDTEEPYCTIPQEDYEALQKKAGFDGTKPLFVRYGTKRFLVTGVSQNGKLMLNTAAVMAVNGKLKKGQAPARDGNAHYRYTF